MSKEAGKAKGVKHTASVQNIGHSRVYELGNYAKERAAHRENYDTQVPYDYIFGRLPDDHEFVVELKSIEKRHTNRMKAISNKAQKIINKEPLAIEDDIWVLNV